MYKRQVIVRVRVKLIRFDLVVVVVIVTTRSLDDDDSLLLIIVRCSVSFWPYVCVVCCMLADFMDILTALRFSLFQFFF